MIFLPPRGKNDKNEEKHVVHHIVVHHVYHGVGSQEYSPRREEGRKGPSLMGIIILLILLCSFLSMLAGNM